MRIQKMILEDVRCFKHLEVNFEASIRSKTVILGNNGNGKSSILKAIALLTCGSSSFGELIGNPNDWIRNGRKRCKITGWFSGQDDKKIELIIHFSDNLEQLISRNQESLSVVDRLIDKLTVVGYGVNRRTGSSDTFMHRGKSRNFRSNNVATLFDHDVSLYPFDAWITNIHYRKGDAALRLISKVLNQVLPGTTLDSIDKENREILFKNIDGVLSFRQLSDGYQATASWIGDLLLRLSRDFSEEPNLDKRPFILLIDELALHLHPEWQRKILDSIGNIFPKAQIIATTHSPFVAQQALGREILSLVRVGKTISLQHFEGDPRKLPIGDLIVSNNLFGLSTDESVELSEKKALLKGFKEKSELSHKEIDQLGLLEIELLNRPISFKDALTEKQLELLEKLEARKAK